MPLIFPLIRLFGLLLFGWGRSQQRCFVKVTSKKSSLIYAEPSVASTSPTVAEGWTWFVTVTKCCLSTERPKVFNPPHHYTSRSYWYRDPGFHIVYIKSSAHREPADRQRVSSLLQSGTEFPVVGSALGGLCGCFRIQCGVCSQMLFYIRWLIPCYQLDCCLVSSFWNTLISLSGNKVSLFPSLCLLWTSAGDGEVEVKSISGHAQMFVSLNV